MKTRSRWLTMLARAESQWVRETLAMKGLLAAVLIFTWSYAAADEVELTYQGLLMTGTSTYTTQFEGPILNSPATGVITADLYLSGSVSDADLAFTSMKISYAGSNTLVPINFSLSLTPIAGTFSSLGSGNTNVCGAISGGSGCIDLTVLNNTITGATVSYSQGQYHEDGRAYA